MRPVVIAVGVVLAQDRPQMVLVPDKGAVQELAAASAGPASAIAFMRGVRTLQSTVWIPASARTAPDAVVKSGPRSRIMNLTRSAWSPRSMMRLRACWVVHVLAGCGVTPGMRMRRVACSITARAYAWVPPGRSAMKKSLAGIAPAWERRNCDQAGPVRRRAGLMPLAWRISQTADAATLVPGPASSRWILR